MRTMQLMSTVLRACPGSTERLQRSYKAVARGDERGGYGDKWDVRVTYFKEREWKAKQQEDSTHPAKAWRSVARSLLLGSFHRSHAVSPLHEVNWQSACSK